MGSAGIAQRDRGNARVTRKSQAVQVETRAAREFIAAHVDAPKEKEDVNVGTNGFCHCH
jgi:hypothetical protein